MRKYLRFTALALACAAAAGPTYADGTNAFMQTNLVASNDEYGAPIIDPNIANAWGIALRPPGAGGHIWIDGNRTGISAEYIGDVNGIPLHQDGLQGVPMDLPAFTDTGHASLTGLVYNAASDLSGQVMEFPVIGAAEDDSTTPPTPITGGTSGSAKFIFVTKDGVINAWRANTTIAEPTAPIAINYSKTSSFPYLANSVFTGVAMSANKVTSTDPTMGNHLYAADFRNDALQVFDNQWTDITPPTGSPATAPYTFAKPASAGSLHPFNVQDLNGHVFVTYAQFNEASDEGFEDNPGFGHVSEFDEQGHLLMDFNSGPLSAADGGALNSPWGMAIAPAGFGAFGGDLLVADFGDAGTIAAFNLNTGQFVDYLRDSKGDKIAIDGIWGLTFGNGVSLGDANSLYFTAGPDMEQDGLFGKLTTVPEPATAGIAGAAMLPLLLRWPSRSRPARQTSAPTGRREPARPQCGSPKSQEHQTRRDRRRAS